jgi:hypothetical protein
MNYKLIAQWLAEHNLVLEQSFCGSLKELSKNYKKGQT